MQDGTRRAATREAGGRRPESDGRKASGSPCALACALREPDGEMGRVVRSRPPRAPSRKLDPLFPYVDVRGYGCCFACCYVLSPRTATLPSGRRAHRGECDTAVQGRIGGGLGRLVQGGNEDPEGLRSGRTGTRAFGTSERHFTANFCSQLEILTTTQDSTRSDPPPFPTKAVMCTHGRMPRQLAGSCAVASAAAISSVGLDESFV